MVQERNGEIRLSDVVGRSVLIVLLHPQSEEDLRDAQDIDGETDEAVIGSDQDTIARHTRRKKIPNYKREDI